jgi:hypothetical protein
MSLLKKKALVLSRELANKLSIRFAGTAGAGLATLVREGFDASGNPIINIDDGTPATTEQCILVRVLEQPSIGLNSLGLTQDSFGPHVIQVVAEASAASAAINRLTQANQMKLWAELLKLGTKVEVYHCPTGAAPVVGDIVAANLVATVQDLYNPLTNEV